MNRKLIFWTIVIFLFCWFFYSVRDVLFPFIIGLLIAYLFDPIADRMEEKGMGRGLAAGLIIALFFTIIIVAGVFLGPIIVDQAESLFKQIPKYYDKVQTEYLPYLKAKIAAIDPEILEKAEDKAKSNSDKISEYIAKVIGGIWGSGLWLFNIISLIAITPFVAFYILRDWDKFVAKIDSLLPREYAPKIRTQAQNVDNTISAFLRGQLNVCLILGIFYSVALTIAGLDYGLLVGFLSGMLCFIPYLGTVIGLITGIGLAFLQFGAEDMTSVGIIAGIYALGQVMEGNFITPKIVGDKVGVHPAWLIFGMLAGGTLLGFIGILIAVPVTASIGVLVKFAVEEYEGSEFYKKSVVPKKAPKKKAKAK